jgi:MerR family redox-sensitive transcriptional activator SoxR
MKIGEIARRARVRPSAIRFYESVGVLPPASRRNGQRHFAAEAELQLGVIEFARKAGFTIAEIKLLFHGFKEGAPASARWRRLARRSIARWTPDHSPQRYAETFEEEHALPLH